MKKISHLVIGILIAGNASAQSLLNLYEVALQADPAYLSARANKSSVYESESIARAQLLPNLSLSANANYIDRNVQSSGTGASDDSYDSQDLTFSVTQPLYRKDRWIALDQAKQGNLRADADLQTAEQDLIVRLAQAYFNVLSAQDTLSFVRADKKAIARQLDQAKQRFEVGLIAITAVHEAQATFDQVTADEIDAENALDNSWEALNEIVNDTGQSLHVLKEELALTPPQPNDIKEWSQTALLQNPAVIAAKNTAEIARQQIESERSGHLPSVDLVASHATSRSDARLGSDTDTGTIGLQLSLPLYAGGGVVASTRQAQFDFQASQQAVEQQQRAVKRQVRDAYRGVISSISRVKALDATVTSSKSALEATEAGFEVGTRTIVDVLDSQRNLFSAMNDYAQARYDYIVNGLLLKQAAGTLSVEDIRQINQWLTAKGKE